MNDLVDCSLVHVAGVTSVMLESGTVGIAPLSTGWSNVNFSTIQTNPGTDPATLILNLLTSVNGDTSNGPYDVFEPGVGLGIPQSLIDLASFTNAQSGYDYDANQRVFFIFAEPVPAKEFIENELCRPFGIYLATGNNGLIRCIRPRHPQKFYIGGSNNVVAFRTPSSASSDTLTPQIPIGVYTAGELATAVSNALFPIILRGFASNSRLSGRVCQYDSVAHAFYLDGTGYDILPSATNAIWNTLGWSSLTSISGQTYAPSARGALPAGTPTLSEDDMWGVQVVDNRDDRIASVSFHYDYDVSIDRFISFKRYTDPEAVNLAAPVGAHDLTIASKGLISAGSTGISWMNISVPPANGCTPVRIPAPLPYSVTADTWTQLYAKTLLDRYKNPPLKFRARLKWKWNTLEVGDVVRVNYSIPGVFMDFERNATTLPNRLFEIVELHPNHDGSLDATFLGHRYVSY